jgi:hypothetical protein
MQRWGMHDMNSSLRFADMLRLSRIRLLFLASLGAWCVASTGKADNSASPAFDPYAYPLKVSSNARYLVDQNNKPFLIVGDSAWCLIPNISLTDAATYFADRASRGFNSVLVSLFAGKDIGSIRPNFEDFDGNGPFTTPGNIGTPNAAYFARVTENLKLAAKYGLCVFLDPIENYGWEKTFKSAGPAACKTFGEYIGKLWKNQPNIIWCHGNDYQDFPAADSVFQAIIVGIKNEDPDHLHTFELCYNNSTTLDIPAIAAYCDLNLVYSYYPFYANSYHAWSQASKPAFGGETTYEMETYGKVDSGSSKIGVQDNQGTSVVRHQQSWGLCSGALCGFLYGDYWSQTFPTGWRNQLGSGSPAGLSLCYLSAQLKARNWQLLSPDITHTFVTAGYGMEYRYPGDVNGADVRIVGVVPADNYCAGSIASDGSFGVVYVPKTSTITVALFGFKQPVTARWFDPVAGTLSSPISGSPFKNSGLQRFTSPGTNSDGISTDWVLFLDTIPTPSI